MLGEGGESRFDTNINFLLEEYGIMVNNGNHSSFNRGSNFLFVIYIMVLWPGCTLEKALGCKGAWSSIPASLATCIF